MTPDLPQELLAWAQDTERRVLRQSGRDLRAEYFHLFPTPEMKELLQIVADHRLDESDALRVLMEAAQDPPRAATVALAVAVQSPFAGDRLLVADRPPRRAPDPAAFTQYVDRHLPDPADTTDLPTARGPLAYGRHYRTLVPLAELVRAPHWLRDPALTGGYVARPPREPSLQGDGRLLALGMLLAAVPALRRDDPGTQLATTALVEYFCGPRAALLTPGLSWQHKVMRWNQRDQQRWIQQTSMMTGRQVALTRAAVWRLADTVPPGWTAPPMTPEQVRVAEERADNIRRREAARQYYALARAR